MEFKTLRKMSNIKSRITTLEFKRADWNLFRELIDRIPLDAALKGKEAQES